jgi:hypothetical protein
MFGIVVAIAAVFCLFRLGARALWQDEGETAVLATSVLQQGIPKARIGDNLVLQDAEAFDRDYTWTFHPWGQFYLAAAGIAALGRTAVAARLPFALCGIATVALLYVFVWRFWRRNVAAMACALLLATSPVFVLHARQCRYYAADALALLVVTTLLTELLFRENPRRWLIAGLGIALALQFYINFGTFCIALIGLVLWCIILNAGRKHWSAVAIALGLAIFLILPGLALHWDRLFHSSIDSSLTFGQKLPAHVSYADGWFVPFLVLLVGGAASLGKMVRGDRPIRLAWACAILVLLGALVLVWPAPIPHLRYLVAMMPLAKLVMGVFFIGLYGFLARWTQSQALSLALAGIAGGLLVATNVASVPMQLVVGLPDQRVPDFCTKTRPYLRSDVAGLLWELSHDFVCPNRIRLAAVNELARPGEVVLTNYGDLPLMFHRPDLVIRGGVGGGNQPVEQQRIPDLVLIQERFPFAFGEYLSNLVKVAEYSQVRLEIPDLIWGNIPEPRAHNFAAPPSTAGLRVYLRKDHADRSGGLQENAHSLMQRWSG